MITLDNKITLIEKLQEKTDEWNQDEIKNITNELSKIYDFKRVMQNYLTIANFYEKIYTKLQTEFGIEKFKLIYLSDSERAVLFKTGDRLEYDMSIEYEIPKDVTISVFLDVSDLSKFQVITLNTYLRSLVDLIYVQFLLTNLEKSVTVDPLTKLLNRISFNTEMKTLVPLARREKMKFGVILINIDRFRAVNDEHGDEFGDKFLQLYAETIQKNIRTSDIAVRFSGGEFLIVLINVENEETTTKIAKKIQDKLAKTYLITPNNDKFKKTVCVGISMFPDDSPDINEVIKYSEMALSDAQDMGRNQLLNYKDITSGGTIELF